MTSNDPAASALADCVVQLHDVRQVTLRLYLRYLEYLRAIRYAHTRAIVGRERALNSRKIPADPRITLRRDSTSRHT